MLLISLNIQNYHHPYILEMKQKKFFAPFLLLITSFVLNAQTIINGTVKNEENQNIPYAAIGIKETNIGSITDENGIYKIIIPKEFDNKNLVFSANGYQEKELNVIALEDTPNVYLKFKTQNIQEVVINANKLKNKIIGEKSRPMLTFSKMFNKDAPTIEQGNIFEIYQKTKIKSFSFHIIPSSKFETVTLKLNIYDVKNDLPSKSLLKENILYKTSSVGWQFIDLSQYKLGFDGHDKICITLQLVDYKPLHDSEFVFGISAKKSLSKKLMFRYQSQSQWQKSEGVFLTNMNVSYDKKVGVNEKKQSKGDNVVLSEKENELISFYENREKGLKTDYGKNSQGKFISLQDGNIYYEEYGSGYPLILLEGNNGIISDFHNQISFFSKYFRVISIDTRNQGKSMDFSKTDYGYEKLADDLLRVINELKLQKVNILGFSDGAITGLLFSSTNSNLVNKLVAIGANSTPNAIDENVLESFKDLYKRASNSLERRRLNLIINHPDITQVDLKKIINPVLIIAGSNDIIKLDNTEFIHEHISSSKLWIVPDSSHYALFEKSQIVNTQILNFLRN